MPVSLPVAIERLSATRQVKPARKYFTVGSHLVIVAEDKIKPAKTK